MDNARALVGNFAITESNALDATNPKSRAELEDYAKLLSKKIATFENQLSYPNFVEILVRDLVASLSVDDTRKISSSLSAMINEKQKLLKDSKGKKKAKKAVANVAARGIDLTNYDDDDLDDGDFM
ncbi:eukaryotic translation initiation factor 3 subunit J [Globomyces pollinis-pini]|nr:eukaryotic translation initiation factor 3 subunit J [Globomyces pollinis-pini]